MIRNDNAINATETGYMRRYGVYETSASHPFDL